MIDLTKLPKWAREYISALEIRLRNTEKRLSTALFDNKKNGSGIVSLWNGHNQSIILNDYSVIEFKLKNSTKITVSLRNEGDDYYVDINGDSHISISPRAANSCYIR